MRRQRNRTANHSTGSLNRLHDFLGRLVYEVMIVRFKLNSDFLAHVCWSYNRLYYYFGSGYLFNYLSRQWQEVLYHNVKIPWLMLPVLMTGYAKRLHIRTFLPAEHWPRQPCRAACDSIPVICPRLLLKSPMISPIFSSGVTTSTFIIGSRRHNFSFFQGMFETLFGSNFK